MSHTCPNHFEETFDYKCIPVEDSASQDISMYFKEAIEYIGESIMFFIFFSTHPPPPDAAAS